MSHLPSKSILYMSGLTLFILLLFLGCVSNDVSDSSEDFFEEDQPMPQASISLSSEELAYLDVLKEKGLDVATRKIEYVYNPEDDGTITGFNYKLLKSFADQYNIPLRFTFVSFQDYFYKEGYDLDEVKVDPSIRYEPELLSRVDLYCDVLTVTPWRQRLFSFVETLPTKEVLIMRKDEVITSLDQLKGKVVAAIRHSTYEQTMKRVGEEIGIEFEFYYVDKSVDQQKAIVDGNADLAVQDIYVAISEVNNYKELSVSLPVTEIQHIGWGIRHDDPLLQSILRKYLDYAMDQGIYETIWLEEYHITIPEYLELMNAD